MQAKLTLGQGAIRKQSSVFLTATRTHSYANKGMAIQNLVNHYRSLFHAGRHLDFLKTIF